MSKYVIQASSDGKQYEILRVDHTVVGLAPTWRQAVKIQHKLEAEVMPNEDPA